MTDSGKQQYTREDFKLMCEENFSEVKKLLVDPDQFNITPEGIADYCKLDPDKCEEHFSQIIGDKFKIEVPEGANTAIVDPGQVTILQEKVLADPLIAEGIMWFLFSTFSSSEEEKTEKKESKKASTIPRKVRVKTNWAEKDVPFKENTRQFVVFEGLLGHNGTKGEFVDLIPSLLDSKGLTPSKSAVSLLATTLADASNRGWNISLDKETQKYSLIKS